jgi:hypothetical protein
MKFIGGNTKKSILSGLIIISISGLAILACRTGGNKSEVANVGGSSPVGIPKNLTAAGVWAQVASDPYKMPLPYNQVSLWKFASSSNNPSPDKLSDRAVTTVNDSDNITARFDKLVHANGTCLRGRWMIDQESPFTGSFAKGTNAPFIGRASVAFNDILRGDYRAFGIAGKIFFEGPNKASIANYKTANFFTIDDLAGTQTPNITDVVFSNEPPLTASNVSKQDPSVAAIMAATIVAFKLSDSNPALRQLYEISELGMSDPSKAITPKWMHLKATTPMLNGHPDFRQDLRSENFSEPLTFNIEVSSVSQANMTSIGKIVIEEMVASDSCDHRLHFHHPKFRDDLRYSIN